MGIFYSKYDYYNKVPIGYNVINEVYFGDSKELSEIQDQISILRRRYYGQSKYFNKINTDPDMLELNRMIEKFFGFKTFSLTLEEETAYNAYTFPVSSTLDAPIGDKIIETTNTGYRFKKEYGLNAITVMNSSLFLSTDFTDREIMAILLHEIGHSFGTGLAQNSTFCGLYSKLLALINVIASIITLDIRGLSSTTNITREWYNKTTEKIKREHPELNNVFHFLKGIEGLLSGIMLNIVVISSVTNTIINPISIFISVIYRNVVNLIKHPQKIIKVLFGYKQEVVSDNFATIYGYGPDLASGLNKMHEKGAGVLSLEVINQAPIIGHLYDLFSLPIDRICSYLDEHPSTPARCDNQLRYLKKELNKQSMDPKMKKQINSDIERLEKEINRMYKNVNFDDPRGFSKAYGGLLINLCGGDLRGYMYKSMNDRFDQVADKSRVK